MRSYTRNERDPDGFHAVGIFASREMIPRFSSHVSRSGSHAGRLGLLLKKRNFPMGSSFFSLMSTWGRIFLSTYCETKPYG